MNEIEALITIARRYCIENHEYWVNEYTNKRSASNNPVYNYSNSDYDIFPRYNALSAILSGVEYLVGSDFNSVEDCKKKLVTFGEVSNSLFTQDVKNEIERDAIQEEREKFCKFVESIETDEPWGITPLPYRRRLQDFERIGLREKLEENWEFDGGYWFPLVELNDNLSVIFISKECLNRKINKKLQQFVTKIAHKYLFEITEDQLDYEIEINSLDLDCYETIICDESLSWVIYGSHESTIAFGGDILVNYVKKIFGEKPEVLNTFPQYD